MDNSVLLRVNAFECYLARELNILDEGTIGYAIAYDFLETTVRRIRCYINFNAPALAPRDANLPEDFCQHCSQAREQYLLRVASFLRQQAKRYHSSDGSFWEDLRAQLMNLSSFADALRQGTAKELLFPR